MNGVKLHNMKKCTQNVTTQLSFIWTCPSILCYVSYYMQQSVHYEIHAFWRESNHCLKWFSHNSFKKHA